MSCSGRPQHVRVIRVGFVWKACINGDSIGYMCETKLYALTLRRLQRRVDHYLGWRETIEDRRSLTERITELERSVLEVEA